jgi:hypothetical protein
MPAKIERADCILLIFNVYVIITDIVNTEKLAVHRSPREELLRRIFAVTQSVTNPHVQADFRLVPAQPLVTPDMEEFVADATGKRHIALLSDGEIAKRHVAMLENRIPVLSGTYSSEGLLLLDVPSGTKPLANYANSIRRNPAIFTPYFREIGTILSGLEDAMGKTLEPTAEFPLLRQFAAADDRESSLGGSIYLLPPYQLSNGNRTDVLNTMHEELVSTRVILPDQATYLVEQINEGWSA